MSSWKLLFEFRKNGKYDDTQTQSGMKKAQYKKSFAFFFANTKRFSLYEDFLESPKYRQ